MDLLSDFGFAVSEIAWPDYEAKDLATRDWPGEDGEDVYIPARIPIKATDLSFEIISEGDYGEIADNFDSLLEWFRTGAFRLYDAQNHRSYKDVYFRTYKDIEFSRDNEGEYMTAQVTVRLTDPINTGWNGE